MVPPGKINYIFSNPKRVYLSNTDSFNIVKSHKFKFKKFDYGPIKKLRWIRKYHVY